MGKKKVTKNRAQSAASPRVVLSARVTEKTLAELRKKAEKEKKSVGETIEALVG